MKRFKVKLFVDGHIPFDLGELIPVFQRWIQRRSLRGLLIDVADYRHVPNGPSIILIGHEADYAFDLRGGQAGLAYTRKQPLEGELSDSLKTAFEQLIQAAHQLENEPSMNGIKFNLDTAEITFLDRLTAPNRPDVFEQLRPSVEAFTVGWYGGEKVQIESVEADPRKCLNIRLAHR